MDTTDFLSATTPVAIWGLVELGLGVVAASAVTLKPLFIVWSTGENPYSSRSKAGVSSKYFTELGSKKAPGRPLRSQSEIELAMDDLNLEGVKGSYQGR